LLTLWVGIKIKSEERAEFLEVIKHDAAPQDLG
jgi:hypothetical protein